MIFSLGSKNPAWYVSNDIWADWISLIRCCASSFKGNVHYTIYALRRTGKAINTDSFGENVESGKEGTEEM